MSLAYSSSEHSARPYRAALDAIHPAPASAEISRATLIAQDRVLAPEWVHRWTTEAHAPPS